MNRPSTRHWRASSTRRRRCGRCSSPWPPARAQPESQSCPGSGRRVRGRPADFQPWRSGTEGNLAGELACLAAAGSYGVAYVYMARLLTPQRLSPFVLAQGQMIAATVLLAPAVLVAGRQAVDLDGSIVAATAMLGFVGTGLAYVINYAIVSRDGATVASTVTYLLPVVAVVLGAAVLDEAVGRITLVGTAVVLLGVTLVRRLSTEARTERSAL
ncbi:MAG TPA: DMT family transporter [Acidimicrobiales bacterium]|nr:DMT family transporter [Acidimicrobiales bacterium]